MGRNATTNPQTKHFTLGDSSAAGSSASETGRASGVNEFAAVPCTRQHAGFKAAKDAIAVARHHAVSPVAEEPRHELEGETQHLPDSPEALEHEKHCIGTRQESFIRLSFFVQIVIEDDVHGVEILRTGGMARQNTRSQRTLQRRETEDALTISSQHELV